MDRSPGVVEHMDVRERPGCAVESGDKPAAVHFVFLTKLELLLYAINILHNLVKPSGTHAICRLGISELRQGVLQDRQIVRSVSTGVMQ